MAMSMSEIVAKSDEKRGVKAKTYKLPVSVIAEIEQLSKTLNIPQNQLIAKAIEQFKATHQ